MAVTVVSSDEVLFQQGFGKTAVDSGMAVDEHTLFAIASTTKAMVVAGILMLADEGKLSLDDPITKHVPELHFQDPLLTQQLTIRDLLTHRTGLIAIIGLDRAADKAVVVLENRDHAEMRQADSRRDWNQDIFDLYEARSERSDGNGQGSSGRRGLKCQ